LLPGAEPLPFALPDVLLLAGTPMPGPCVHATSAPLTVRHGLLVFVPLAHGLLVFVPLAHGLLV
jgi:hypothetical protein